MLVVVEGRKFIVKFDPAGEPSRIFERKLWLAGTIYEQWINAPYWHKSHKRPMRGLVATILQKAEQTS